MATHEELIAANFTIDEIREKIGADSLGFLSKEGLLNAVARKRGQMCLGCLTGEYPETYNGPPMFAELSATSS
jgi:amidophosphoribosyltransferase